MVTSIVAGFLGDLVFLPALLKLFPTVIARKLPLKAPANVLPFNPAVPSELPLKKVAMVAGLSLLLLAAHTSQAAATANEADTILHAAQKNIETRSDQATVTLKTTETNGEVLTRVIKLKSLREQNKFYAMARILSPADIKGTALLAEIENGTENQWLYTPSSKQVRRIVTGKNSGGILGSELNSNDLSSDALRGASAKLLQKNATRALVEVLPVAGTSAYSKSVIQFALPKTLTEKITYFSGSKEVKTVEFKDYIATKSGIVRAKKIIVKNLTNNRFTEVDVADPKINLPFKSDDFTVGALKD